MSNVRVYGAGGAVYVLLLTCSRVAASHACIPSLACSTITEPKSDHEHLLVKADDLGKKSLESEDVCDKLIALLLDGLDKVRMLVELNHEHMFWSSIYYINSRFMISSPDCTVHMAITCVITVLEQRSITCYTPSELT